MMVLRAWKALVTLLDTREAATCLALFRIAMALTVFTTLFEMWMRDVHLMTWVDMGLSGYRPIRPRAGLIHWMGGATPDVVGRVIVGTMFFALASAAGIGGRVTNFITLQLLIALVTLNTHAGGSYDELMTNALWLLVLAPSTKTLSVDCYLQTGQWTSDAKVPAWVRYLAVFQILTCYWTTGLQKLSVYWTPGGDFSALYYIFQQPSWQRFDMEWVAYVYPLSQFATAMTWFWEVLIPLWVLAYYFRYTADSPGRVRAWFNRVDVRSWFVVIGLVFHLSVTAFMNVGPFSFASMAYFACFFTPDEVHSAWARVKARVVPA